jgi:hypothetical protein
MIVHIQSVNMDVWNAMTKGRYQPHVVANGVAHDKPKADWSYDEKTMVQYDLKARNILNSSLVVNEYHSSLIVKPLRLCGTRWKLFMKEPTTSSDQKLILSFNNMNSFTWTMVNPSPPCK